MSSSTFVDSVEDKDDQLIIIVNADGTITVDPETLQKLIANQHGGNLSVVRVGDSVTPDDSQEGEENDGGGAHVNLTVEGFYSQSDEPGVQPVADGGDPGSEVVDPFLVLEPEHYAKLESVLQSDQAKEILGTNLVEDNNLNSMLDILEGKDEVSPSAVHNDHSYTTSIPAFQQPQAQIHNATVQVQQPSLHHRPLTRGGRSRGGRGRGLMTRGGRGGNSAVHQVLAPGSSPVIISQSQAKVIQASPHKTSYVVAPSSSPRVIAQPIAGQSDEEQSPKIIHRRTILTKLPQAQPQLKQQKLQAILPSPPPTSVAQDTGGSPTVVTSTPLVIQRKVALTRGGRGRGRGGGRGRRIHIANGDEVSAALQAMELSPPQSQPPISPITASSPKQQQAQSPQSEQETSIKKKPTMPTVIIRKIGSKSEIVSSPGKGNKVRHHSEEDNSSEQYAIVQPQQQQQQVAKTVKQVLIQKNAEPPTTHTRAKELASGEDSLKKKKDKKAVMTSPPAVTLGPELFSTPDIIRRVSTDKPSDTSSPQTSIQIEPKVQVQPTHPPFKPVIECDEMTPESLLDSIHAEVAAKDDSRLIAEALLLDDLTNDDSQSMSYPGKEKIEPVRSVTIQQTHQSQQQNQKTVDGQTPRIRKLPPIELPATRSATKKAAATPPQTNSASQQQLSRNTAAPKEKKHGAAIVSEKRFSTEAKKVAEREKKIPVKEDFVSDFEDEDGETDEESWNSEDDPDRLWCICKKPHNNRFMICCDGCEEWFHGKCVGITKALGQQMESKGIEWSCPNCLQARAQKVQDATKPASTMPSSKLSSGQHHPGKVEVKPRTISSLECIVCKKPAKVDSNYCSDICVRKHALSMLALLKKETEGLQLHSRVVVYEKKSGKLLAGNEAPTVQILADWLLEHQTYEIAKPSVLPPNKFYKRPAITPLSPSQQGAQQKPAPHQQAADAKSPQPPQAAHNKPTPPQKQAQPQLKQQLLQMQKVQPPQAKHPQPKTPLKQPQSAVSQVKQPQQPAQAQSKQQAVKQQQQSAKPPGNKQGGNEKGGNLKQTVLTHKITASGTKEIGGYAPKQATPSKVQVIQPQPLAAAQASAKVKGKEEEDAKSKKPAAKINVPSPSEAAGKRLSVDGKKIPTEKPAVKEEKRRDSVCSTKDKDEKKKEEKKKRKDSTSETAKPPEETTPVGATLSVEPVRANVKRTLQELLSQRVKQDDSVTISNEEIKELVTLIEEELFALFKDTNAKYKSKYRSLVFNIKDPKNLTLYKKIVEKSISPMQLVRLSPEELASQELAQWREKEAKHQLEIIKKNELDLIQQTKTVVLKSRKGEEVIETKAVNISELESVLNRTADDYEVENILAPEIKEEEKSLEKINDKKKEEHNSRDRKKKKDEKRPDRSRSRRRSRSRSRDRDKRKKEKGNDKVKEKEKDKLDEKAVTLKEIEEVISQHISIPPPPPSQPDSDLSDREPSSTVNISTPPLEEEKPPVWRGILNMSEVTKLHTSAYEVSGSCEDLGEELSEQLDCVGRIQPDSVWEYVSRMKKAGTKDIIVIRFHSDAEEEKMNYLSLYSYLNSRNRMAVIGQVSKTVKDFYVLPLASHSPIPQVLLPLDGPGFDDYRTHLLLGIIIRTRKGSSSLSLSTRSRKSSSALVSSSSKSERSYTPPLPADGGTPPTTPPPLPLYSKPYSHPPGLTPPLPDDDEPYSPGEDDLYSPEDNQAEAILVNPEIQRNLEEVNRMIEQKRQQIQNIAQAAAGTQVPAAVDEEAPYSPSSSFTPPRQQGADTIPFLDTNEIKLPPNLQDILASIKGPPTMDVKSDPIVKAYTSQAYHEEEEEEDLKEEEKDVKSERTSRDPRQRPDPPKPKSALSQLSDSELIRKAAEMESEEKKEYKQATYYYAPVPPPPAVAPPPIFPPPPQPHYKYPPSAAPPPPPPVIVKERKRKDKFKERRPPPPPMPHPQRRKWDSGHHNRGMMQHRPSMRGGRPQRFRGGGGFDHRGRGGFRGFRRGGPPRFRGGHGRDRNVQSEWDEEIRNFEQRKARERKRRASRTPSPRRRSPTSPPRRRSRRASSGSS